MAPSGDSGALVSAGGAGDARLEPGVERSGLRHVPALLAGLSVVGAFVFWGARDGGFDPVQWMPGTLFVLALLVAVLLGSSGVVRLTRAQGAAALALFGFTAWSTVSIHWADVPSDAWLGATRTLLYASVFILFALLPWTPRSATWVLVAYAAGITGVAALTVYRVATVEDDAFFGDGRLTPPTGYSNANVALFLGAFCVALALATRREQPVAVRAGALGAVAFLPQVAFLAHSRAALFAVPLTAAVVLLASPGRLRILLGLAVAAVPLAVAWDVHYEVSRRAEEGSARFLEDVMQPSARAMLVSSLLAVVAGLAWSLVDRRVTLAPGTHRAAGVVAAGVVAAGLAAGTVLLATADPVERARVGWDEFTSNTTDYEGESRYGSLDSQRWDHWRVAMGRFAERPLTGIGAEQFAVDYVRERRSTVDSRYAHSLEVGVLSQLGVVGAALFGVFVALALWFTWPRRAGDPLATTVRLAAFGVLVYWLAHGSVDWFYEIPAVTAPVFALVALAGAVGESSPERAPVRGSALVATVVSFVLVLAVVSVAVQYLAEREVDRAVTVWASDPEAAYHGLDRARRLNPLSDEPDVYAGAIAAKLGDRRRMRAAFERALERNPLNWYAHLELALVHSLAGERRRALARVREARALNPADPVLVEVEARLERGERVTPRSVDPLFVERIEARLR